MTEPAPSKQAWCLFQVRSQHLGVPLAKVAEIVEICDLVPLPLAAPPVVGLAILRRDVIPIVDVEARPEPQPRTPKAQSVALVLYSEHGPWGLRVDREGTHLVEAEAEGGGLMPAEASGGELHAWVRHGELRYTLIDPEAIWRKVRGAVLGGYLPGAAEAAPDDNSRVWHGMASRAS